MRVVGVAHGHHGMPFLGFDFHDGGFFIAPDLKPLKWVKKLWGSLSFGGYARDGTKSEATFPGRSLLKEVLCLHH